MSLYMQIETSLPFFPVLISRLSLCGLTGRSSPVNLIYPLFLLCLPPASHIFSTWQNLNLSAERAHSCFLWTLGRGSGGIELRRLVQMWMDRGITMLLIVKNGPTKSLWKIICPFIISYREAGYKRITQKVTHHTQSKETAERQSHGYKPISKALTLQRTIVRAIKHKLRKL